MSNQESTTTPEQEFAREDSIEAAERINRELIARRAYEISLTDGTGSELENWLRAEEELRATDSA